MTNGLLAQLPDLGDIEQIRELIESGLSDALGQISTWGVAAADGSPLRPLADALSTAGAAPDLGSMLAPLHDVREQISAAIPTDLDVALATIAPLLDAVAQLVDGSVIEPILADLRAGRSINEIASDALGIALQQVVGQLAGLSAGALGGESRAAIEGLLAAAAALGSAPDPAVIAGFIAERLFGMPIAPLGQITGLRDGLASTAATMLEQSGGVVDTAEQVMASALTAAATQLEAIDSANAAAWPPTLMTLRETRDALTTLRSTMQAVPGTVNAGLDALNLDTYRDELRSALHGLVSATSGGAAALGHFASLNQLVQTMAGPLDELTTHLVTLSPGAFSSQFQGQLDMLGALLDTLGEQVSDNPVIALFEDLQEVVDNLADAIRSVRQTLEQAIAALLAAVDAVAAQVAAVRQQVEGALRAIAEALAAIDIAALAASLEQALDQTVGLIDQIPVRQLRDALDQALTQVEALVNQLAEVAETVLQQATPLIGALEQIDLEQAAEPVLAAVLAGRDALEGLDLSFVPDSLLGELSAVVDPFFAEVKGTLATVQTELTKNFADAADAVKGLADRLAERIGQFAETVRELDPSELLRPLTMGFKEIDAAVARLSGAQLTAALGTQIEQLRDELAKANPAQLLAPIEQAFEEQLLAPVRELNPAELLQPLIDAFTPVEELVATLDFSEALGGLGEAAGALIGEAHAGLTGAAEVGQLPGLDGMAEQVQPVINLLRPGSTIDEWADQLNNLLGSYRPTAIFAPLLSALQPLDDWLNSAPDTVLLELFGLLKSMLGKLNSLEPPAALFREPLEQTAAAIEANRPAAVLDTLHAPYERLRAALARIDRATLPANTVGAFDQAAELVSALDPIPVLAPMESIFASLPERVRRLATASFDLSELRAEFGTALSVATGAFPAFLRGELPPGTIGDGLAAISPQAQIRRLETRFDAFLAAAQRFGPAIQSAIERFMGTLGERIANLSPAALFERFDELFAPIRDAIGEISPRAIANALGAAYEQLTQRLDALHPRAIRESAQALFDIALAKLDELRTAVLDVIAAVFDRAIGKLRELLGELNPQALIIGLGNFFALIDERLTALGLDALFGRLVAVFERLNQQLTAVLKHATSAVDQLVEATPI